MEQKSKISKTYNQSKIKKVFGHTETVIFFATIVIMVISYFFNTAVFSQYNISTLLRQMSFIAIVAFGETLILIVGGIDLSVGSVAAMAAVLPAMLMTRTAINPYLIFVMGLVLGALCGLFNGFFITRFKITSFIVTLAASQIFLGILYVVTKGRTIQGMPKSFTIIGQGMLGGILPYPALFMLILGAILIFVLKNTPFGRHLYAVGGNVTAAKLVGINVEKTTIIAFMLSGVFAAFAGMLIMARLGTAQPTLGSTWVLPAITAAVLGGTSMTGGRGGILGTIIGALLMTEVSYAIVTMRVSTYWEQIVIGVVVIIAVLIDSIRMR